MGNFYSVRDFRGDNLRHIVILSCIFIVSFIILSISTFAFIPASHSYIWDAIKVAPLIFGILTYVVIGLSLSYLAYKCFSKVLCFTAVVSDRRYGAIVNGMMVNIFLLNLMASSLIGSYLIFYFLSAGSQISHFIGILQISLVLPVTYCMRILEGCIVKIIGQSDFVEKSCYHLIKQAQNS